MKNINKLTIITLGTLFVSSLFLTACGSTAVTVGSTPTVQPVNSGDVITSEGRVEPIHYAEIALNTGGLVSEVLSKEGDQVEAGQVIARLQNDQAQTLESAQANALQQLTAAHQAARDAQYNLDKFDIPGDFVRHDSPTGCQSDAGSVECGARRF